ncbi:MAG: hypothetical protein JHC95_01530 [Solirubrobacteraceae bacterium]|nr:hypothetical protein [Solirubrobacteraceae bacterium]
MRTSRPQSLGTRVDALASRPVLLGGLILTLGAMLVGLALVSANGVPGTSGYEFRVDVPGRTPPLKVSDAVRIAGKPAGKIVALAPAADHVRVTISLDSGSAPIGRDARVAVRVVLGTSLAYVTIDPGEVDDPLPSGEVLRSGPVAVGSSLPQALEIFDRETRNSIGAIVTETAAGVQGQGMAMNGGLRDLNALARDGAPLLQAVAREHALGPLVRDAGPVMRATLGRRPDDIRQGIADLDAVLSATAAVSGDLRKSIENTAALQRRYLQSATDYDATARSATALLDEALPALRSVREIAPDATDALDDVRALRAPIRDLDRITRPSLRRLEAIMPKLVDTAGTAQPMLVTLNRLSQQVGPYLEDLLAAAAGAASASRGTLGGERGLRASISLGCHTNVNPLPAPKSAHLDRKSC